LKKLIIALASALLLTTAPVLAAPSVNGSTGLINIPTADVLRSGQFSLGYYHLKDGGVGTFNTNIVPNVEVGVTGFRYDSQQNKTNMNAKFGIVPETVLTPGLSVGVEDIANHDKRSSYVVASKTLPFGFRIHAGTGNGNFHGVFAGIEKTLNPISMLTGNDTFPATTLIAEYDGKTMNYGARLSIISGLKLDAGIRNHNGYVGVTFSR